MTNRMKKVMIILGTLCFLLATFFIINDVVLKNHVFVKETYIKDARIPESFDGVRVVQFSDALIETDDDVILLENLITKLDKIKPDILIFTGDLFVRDKVSSDVVEKVETLLSKIDVPIGKVAILGDQDYVSPDEESLAETVLDSASFHVLANETLKLYNGSKDYLSIVGLTPLASHQTLTDSAINLKDDEFSILLMHEPTLAPLLADYPVDLQLSGHCLGSTTTDKTDYQACAQFTSGTYQFADQMTLHVNEGLQAKASRQTIFTQSTIHSFLLLKQ